MSLIPAVEEELSRRGDRLHAARMVNGEAPATREERRVAFGRLAPDTFVRVVGVPEGHAGDFRAVDDLFGDVAVTFTRDPYSNDIYWRRPRSGLAASTSTPATRTSMWRVV